VLSPAPIPVMRPTAPAFHAVAPYLEAVHASGRYSNLGPQETHLRDRFARLLGVDADQVVTVASATLGLAGAIAVSPASRWSVPSFTFTATPAAVEIAGRKGRFVDVGADWWMDTSGPDDPGTGLIPVAPFGSPFDLRSWRTSSEIVIDAAASLGSQPVLTGLPPTWAVVFSLHATKVLGAGEGGIVVFGDPGRADACRNWSNFGFAGTRESIRLGANAKMSEIHAAYGHAALDGWATERAEWADARRLTAGLQRELEQDLAVSHPGLDGVSPYWVVRFRDAATAAVVESTLNEHGVETRRWWSGGCHRMPAYRHWDHGALPETEAAAAVSLGLPMFRGLSVQDVGTIGGALDAARRALTND
jgi:dTDP-4-amino-4,6-dideoxygalactose transaminase